MSMSFRLLSLLMFLVVSLVSGCGGGADGSGPLTSDVPGHVVAVAGDGQVNLQWDAVEGASSYTVYISPYSAVTKTSYEQKIEVLNSQATVDSLLNKQRYYFLVTSSGDTNESAASAMVSAVPQILVTAVIQVVNFGSITLELFQSFAPVTVANFVTYADDGFYNGTLFHRVIDGFMIQGGGFEPNMVPKAINAPIVNEANNGLSNVTGTIAMARMGGPSGRDSATSQFFINVVDNTGLDYVGETEAGWGYAVFGHVTDGMDVVNAIKGVSTYNAGSYANMPVDDVVISSVKIVQP